MDMAGLILWALVWLGFGISIGYAVGFILGGNNAIKKVTELIYRAGKRSDIEELVEKVMQAMMEVIAEDEDNNNN